MATAVSTPRATSTAGLQRLIEDVRRAVQGDTSPERAGTAVAKCLQPYLAEPDFLSAEQMEPDATAYCRHILHVEPDESFSIVALVWLPGQETPVHDHVSWCVVGVYRGEEDETTFRLAGDETDQHLVVTDHTVHPAGSVVALVPPGDIHRVKNSCEGIAVSLHVYGADVEALGSSILRRYEQSVRP